MKLFLTVFLAATCSITAVSQESLYLAFISCEGCDTQTGVSATYLLNDYINGYGRYKVEMAQKRDSSFQLENSNLARESAELLSTKFFLVGRILRIEDNYYVSVMMYATESGLMVWKTSALTTELNDLPTILDDFASRLADDKTFSRNGDVYRVYQGESKKVKRIKSNVGLGVSTGAFMEHNYDDQKNVIPGAGLLISFDSRRFIFESSFEMYVRNSVSYGPSSFQSTVTNNNEYRYRNLYINTIYPLRTTNSAPFVCLGAGVSMYSKEVSSYEKLWLPSGYDIKVFPNTTTKSTDFLVNGGVGYILKRNSTATLFIYGRGYIKFNDLQNGDLIYGAQFNLALVIGK